jgi:hypothetical protein
MRPITRSKPDEACAGKFFSANLRQMNRPGQWLIGLLALGILFVLLRSMFSRHRRAQRRRDRSHRPVISRRQGPTVKLAATVKKPRRDAER